MKKKFCIHMLFLCSLKRRVRQSNFRFTSVLVFLVCLGGCINFGASLSHVSFRSKQNSHTFNASYSDVWDHVCSFIYSIGRPTFVDPDAGIIRARIEPEDVTLRIIPLSQAKTQVLLTQKYSKKTDLHLPHNLFNTIAKKVMEAE
jgi:hypothetical protein